MTPFTRVTALIAVGVAIGVVVALVSLFAWFVMTTPLPELVAASTIAAVVGAAMWLIERNDNDGDSGRYA